MEQLEAIHDAMGQADKLGNLEAGSVRSLPEPRISVREPCPIKFIIPYFAITLPAIALLKRISMFAGL